MQKWWGYIHVNGTVKIKPYGYYDKASLEDALESEFVQVIFKPFVAENREDAAKKIFYPYLKHVFKEGNDENYGTKDGRKRT